MCARVLLLANQEKEQSFYLFRLHNLDVEAVAKEDKMYLTFLTKLTVLIFPRPSIVGEEGTLTPISHAA